LFDRLIFHPNGKMLVLCHETTGVKYGLQIGAKYRCGRVGTDFVFALDTSVSRNHAEITTSSDGEGVFIKDLGSKYGTYLGEKAVKSSQSGSQRRTDSSLDINEEKLLRCGQIVRFGLLQSVFRLQTSRLVICTSGLSSPDMSVVKKTIEKLNGCAELTGSFGPNVTHLLIKEGKLTIKVANALAKCLPMVTMSFLQDYLNCLNSKQALPDPKNYVPPLKESAFNSIDVSLDINPARKEVFKGMKFTFSTGQQCDKYKEAIGFAGGSTELLIDPGFNPEDFTNPKNILVQANQCSNPRWQKAVQVLDSNNLVAIQEAQIALAILHASCLVHCNPERKMKVVVGTPRSQIQKKNSTLVSETERSQVVSQVMSEQISTLSSEVVMIDETASSSARRTLPSTPTPSSSGVRMIPETDRTATIVSSDNPYNNKPGGVSEFFDTSLDGGTKSQYPTQPLKSFKPPPKPQVKSTERKSLTKFDAFDDDEDDLFNFDEEEEEKVPEKETVPLRKRKRSEDDNIIKNHQPCKKMNVVEPVADRVSVVMPEVVSKKHDDKLEKSVVKKTSGFLCKSIQSNCSTATTVKSEIPEEDLTRSFITLEVRSLVVAKKSSNSSTIKMNNSGENVKNVKRFKKQAIGNKITTPISCITNIPARNLENFDEMPSVSGTSAAGASQSFHQDSEAIEDLWNFNGNSQQSSFNSRKRKR